MIDLNLTPVKYELLITAIEIARDTANIHGAFSLSNNFNELLDEIDLEAEDEIKVGGDPT